MTDKSVVRPRRRRPDDPSGLRSEKPKEPARPPRMRAQATYATTIQNSDLGNATRHNASAEAQGKPS